MEQKITGDWKQFSWYNIPNSSNTQRLDNKTNTQLLYERLALALMVTLTTFALYSVPSWENAFTDPCHLASILCEVTVLQISIIRLFGNLARVLEPVIMALFLASMPLIYIASCLIMGSSVDNIWLWVEILALPLYTALAVLGLKKSPWFLAIGIAAHGFGWDIWHYSNSTYIPNWYAIGCLIADVSISIYIATRIPAWRTKAS